MKNEKTVPYNLRLPAKLKTKLEREAKDQKRSLNSQIIHVLESFQNAAIFGASGASAQVSGRAAAGNAFEKC